MPKAKKGEFHKWKCSKCGLIRWSRKGLPPEEFEMMEKARRSGANIIPGELEICPRCQIPMQQQEGWMF